MGNKVSARDGYVRAFSIAWATAKNEYTRSVGVNNRYGLDN